MLQEVRAIRGRRTRRKGSAALICPQGFQVRWDGAVAGTYAAYASVGLISLQPIILGILILGRKVAVTARSSAAKARRATGSRAPRYVIQLRESRRHRRHFYAARARRLRKLLSLSPLLYCRRFVSVGYIDIGFGCSAAARVSHCVVA